jgi:hypothetical protein
LIRWWIAKVTNPTNRVEASKDASIIRFNNHKSCSLVVAVLVESFWSIELKSNLKLVLILKVWSWRWTSIHLSGFCGVHQNS